MTLDGLTRVVTHSALVCIEAGHIRRAEIALVSLADCYRTERRAS